ncbi:MAG TPA: hypothetical protein DIT48_04850 [Actinobacteria bacterium]|nr:hypothetical protein [Actinomycetota bacterium]
MEAGRSREVRDRLSRTPARRHRVAHPGDGVVRHADQHQIGVMQRVRHTRGVRPGNERRARQVAFGPNPGRLAAGGEHDPVAGSLQQHAERRGHRAGPHQRDRQARGGRRPCGWFD